jgi:hypothetical protein
MFIVRLGSLRENVLKVAAPFRRIGAISHLLGYRIIKDLLTHSQCTECMIWMVLIKVEEGIDDHGLGYFVVREELGFRPI